MCGDTSLAKPGGLGLQGPSRGLLTGLRAFFGSQLHVIGGDTTGLKAWAVWGQDMSSLINMGSILASYFISWNHNSSSGKGGWVTASTPIGLFWWQNAYEAHSTGSLGTQWPINVCYYFLILIELYFTMCKSPYKGSNYVWHINEMLWLGSIIYLHLANTIHSSWRDFTTCHGKSCLERMRPHSRYNAKDSAL